MKVVTAEEMRNIDQCSIQRIGIPGIVLMENAGLGVVHAIDEKYGESRPKVSIFVGKGNNGGDGLVVARHLTNRGYDVQTYVMADANAFTGDALINLQIARNMNLPLEFMLSDEDLAKYKEKIASTNLLVDSIFGTGLKGAVRGFAANAIEFLNSTGLPIVAIDLPSGLDADTGKVEGACIKAVLTVTMALPKRGLLMFPGANYVGELKVVDIGVPHHVIESQNISVNLVQSHDAAKLLPDRPGDAHKGTFGRAVVIAGSVGFTGAAAMASQAALRVGTGLVSLGIPESLNPIMEVKLTEAMTRPLPETEALTLAMSSRDEIMKMLENANVVAIGPGLSRHPETVSLIQYLCKEIQIPKVIDADGLNALSDAQDILRELGPNTVLTPHPGEMSRLMANSTSQIQSDRINIARNFAKENGLVLVLKGAPTVTADSQGNVFINTTGNPGLASGGTGDVLTGAIAGFIAQGLNVVDAAILGVYIHGLAGDMAAMEYGEAGMLAQDVIGQLPKAIQKLKMAPRIFP